MYFLDIICPYTITLWKNSVITMYSAVSKWENSVFSNICFIFSLLSWIAVELIMSTSMLMELALISTKKRRRGRNVIGHRATGNVPRQRGGNITMCAAISNTGVVAQNSVLGP